MSFVAIVTVVLLGSTQPKVAFMGLSSGEGVSDSTASSLSDALAAELRNQWKVELVTSRELTAVLSIERQKALLGCEDNACVAEIAGALDVDEVVTGSVSKLGESWLLQVQRVDAAKALTTGHASRRTKGRVDALLDQLPGIVGELTGSVAVAERKRAVTKAAEAEVPAKPLAPSTADVPLGKGISREKLEVLTDGKGLYLAVEPWALTDGVFLAGTEESLYSQRVFGGGSEQGKRYDFVFWEPRVRAPYQAEFAYREGEYTLTCGDEKVKLQKLGKKKAAGLLKRAKLFDVRWQRAAHAIARDDEGNYFVVDRSRRSRDVDYRLFVGSRGSLRGEAAEVLAQDAAGEVFRTASGRLKLQPREKKASWTRADGKPQELTWLAVEDQARFIYGQLGVYKGEPLGTPCDAYLK